MVLTVVFMCTVVAVTHYVFPITMTAFVIPVLMSVVFGNNRMTAATAASCSVCVILTGIWRNIDGTDTDRYYVVQEVVISLGIIFMSLIVAEIVNSLITEQNHRCWTHSARRSALSRRPRRQIWRKARSWRICRTRYARL